MLGDDRANPPGERHRVARRPGGQENRDHAAGEVCGDIAVRQQIFDQQRGFVDELLDRFKPHGVPDGGVITQQDV